MIFVYLQSSTIGYQDYVKFSLQCALVSVVFTKNCLVSIGLFLLVLKTVERTYLYMGLNGKHEASQ